MRYPQLLTLTMAIMALGCEASTGPTVNSTPTSPPPAPTAPPAVPVAPPAAPVTETRVTADQMLGVDAPNQKGADQAWTYTRTLFTNYFGVKEDVAMGQVKQALAFFEAQHGRKPATNEEGMEAIKDIPLPELPDDRYRYEYDPARHELMVLVPTPGQ